MATTNYGWNTPVVGGNDGTWGGLLNANWTSLDTLLNGVTQAEISLLKGQTSLVPSGVIVMWSGSVASIPSGWYICDGTNGTPDLTGRFVVHADADSGGTYNVGDTGGADSVTLTEAQMPAHTHTVSGTTSTDGAHSHGYQWYSSSGPQTASSPNYAGGLQTIQTTTEGDHSHTVTGTAASTGGGGSHENRPPYYALAYIMKA